MNLLRRILGGGEARDSSPFQVSGFGVLFVFDWQDISRGGEQSYGNYAINRVFPYFYPKNTSLDKRDAFTFWEGDTGQSLTLSRPPLTNEFNWNTWGNVLKRPREASLFYLLAVFGTWGLHPGLWERIHAELTSGKTLGYLGIFTFENYTDLSAFDSFVSQRLGLVCGCIVNAKRIQRVGWKWMNDKVLSAAGFLLD